MKKKVEGNRLYVVNFFATPLINYTELITLQAKENSSPVYDPKK